MASPQKENGFTPIAHEILDEICQCNFNGAQLRIVLKLWRMTYGYNRKDHEFAVSFIQDVTKLSKSTVKREVAALIKSRVIVVTKEETNTEGRRLAFNKNYEAWLIAKGGESMKQMDMFEVPDSPPQTTGLEVSDMNPPEVPDLNPPNGNFPCLEVSDMNPIYIKKILKKLFIEKKNEFEYFYFIYPRKTAKPAAKKAWDKLVNAGKFDAVETVFRTMNFAETIKRIGTEQKYIPYPGTFLNQKRYEDYPVIDPEGIATSKQSKAGSNIDFLLGDMGGDSIDRTRGQTLIGEGGRSIPE